MSLRATKWSVAIPKLLDCFIASRLAMTKYDLGYIAEKPGFSVHSENEF
jgi:hypothetical protein